MDPELLLGGEMVGGTHPTPLRSRLLCKPTANPFCLRRDIFLKKFWNTESQ